ncbi:thiolase family protein [Beggiatoa alba]|nr:thiolase family protein [Beggiatoa alba]
MNDVVITAAKRTPIGSYLGQFAALSSPALASHIIRQMIKDHPVISEHIDECLMGCALSAAVGQAPARQAVLDADLPDNIPCTTVNKACGSGMKTLAMSHDSIRIGNAGLILAGGMESMSNAPYMIRGRAARQGMRIGHTQILDHMFYDGLENYRDGKLMGCFAERTATMHGFTRAQQDSFAIESVKRARNATEANKFRAEIVSVDNIYQDEQVFRSDLAKIPKLKPAFSDGGSVTAANSSSISDGAALCLLADAEKAKALGLNVMARVLAHSSHAKAPEEFTTAVPGAINKVLKQVGWKLDEVDLFEINEAFAVVVLSAMERLGIEHRKVNIHGGACAMGHPIGASGCRVVVTLVHAMLDQDCHKGIASVCIGGGEAMAIAIEM